MQIMDYSLPIISSDDAKLCYKARNIILIFLIFFIFITKSNSFTIIYIMTIITQKFIKLSQK